jgi:hypothetical protein
VRELMGDILIVAVPGIFVCWALSDPVLTAVY